MTNQYIENGANRGAHQQQTHWARHWARFLNALFGAWLVLSAFLWEHSAEAHVNSLVVGAITFLAALISPYAAYARTLSITSAVWLVVSARVVETTSSLTIWNNIVVGILVFAFSLGPAYASFSDRS